MASDSNTARSGGIGFSGLLAVLFIGLKLGHVIDWSWWWALARTTTTQTPPPRSATTIAAAAGGHSSPATGFCVTTRATGTPARLSISPQPTSLPETHQAAANFLAAAR